MPLWKVKTVAVDNSSRTSAVLARIVFDEFYQTRPDFRPSPPDLASMLAQNDAAVLIGDTALKFMKENELPNAEKQKAFLRYGPEPLEVFDLAERWKFLTGLPFVFAFWAARPGFQDEESQKRCGSLGNLAFEHSGDRETLFGGAFSEGRVSARISDPERPLLYGRGLRGGLAAVL